MMPNIDVRLPVSHSVLLLTICATFNYIVVLLFKTLTRLYKNINSS